MASHIVGGEFELLHISGNTYQLNMILYFDKINGSPGAKDQPGVNVSIFRKADNNLMGNVFLSLISERLVKRMFLIPSLHALKARLKLQKSFILLH